MADHDPHAWAEDFHRWMLDRCAGGDRYFGGIRALHRNFRDWSLGRGEVPCTEAVFGRLLNDAGFLIAYGLVSGVMLREDLEGPFGFWNEQTTFKMQ